MSPSFIRRQFSYSIRSVPYNRPHIITDLAHTIIVLEGNSVAFLDDIISSLVYRIDTNSPREGPGPAVVLGKIAL